MRLLDFSALGHDVLRENTLNTPQLVHKVSTFVELDCWRPFSTRSLESVSSRGCRCLAKAASSNSYTTLFAHHSEGLVWHFGRASQFLAWLLRRLISLSCLCIKCGAGTLRWSISITDICMWMWNLRAKDEVLMSSLSCIDHWCLTGLRLHSGKQSVWRATEVQGNGWNSNLDSHQLVSDNDWAFN